MKIYALKDRESNRVGYVGASDDPLRRLYQHLRGQSTPIQAWLLNLKDLPQISILEDVPPDSDWRLREQYWIGTLDARGEPLRNSTISKPFEHNRAKCLANDCPRPATRKGLCNAHYMREYRRQQKMKPGYENGIEEGRQQVADAVNSLLEPHGGSCSLWDDTLYLESQGQTLKTKIV